MNKNGQGVLQKSKLKSWLIHILLPVTCLFFYPAFAETSTTSELTNNTASTNTNAAERNIYFIYSQKNKLHSTIIQKLSEKLQNDKGKYKLIYITDNEKIQTLDNKNDLIIAIGHDGMQSAERTYKKTTKLFISTDPSRYKLKKINNKNDAILYMTQPYCRQIKFIKQLNTDWHIISVLSSKEKPAEKKLLQQCANKFGIGIYTVSVSSDDILTDKIRHALQHSNVLLALPDSSIYNSKTAKNILLTSYRYRKPVIAFSKNFVNAGAAAAISSNTEQIAKSAKNLIEHYFDSDNKFSQAVNYPDSFDININHQVFRALDISLPDGDKLKQSIQEDTGNTL